MSSQPARRLTTGNRAGVGHAHFRLDVVEYAGRHLVQCLEAVEQLVQTAHSKHARGTADRGRCTAQSFASTGPFFVGMTRGKRCAARLPPHSLRFVWAGASPLRVPQVLKHHAQVLLLARRRRHGVGGLSVASAAHPSSHVNLSWCWCWSTGEGHLENKVFFGRLTIVPVLHTVFDILLKMGQT